MRRIYTIPTLILALLIASGCVTQKKKDDIGPVKKFYHDLTAEFNGYYNATVLMTESYAALDNQYQDNYNKVLPIWKYTEADNPKAQAGDLDEAIKKVSVAISLHRQSHWVDDCYLLMGQAQYLKQDYEAAEETFLYMVDEFNPLAMRKKGASKKKVTVKRKKGEEPTREEMRSMSKKQRQKLAKKKKKQKEKDRKQKSKEIKKRKKARKKGKKLPPSKSRSNTVKKDDAKKDTTPTQKEEKLAEADEPVPSSIRLGNLEPDLPANTKPEKYIIKHRPSYQEGILWLARTHIERENYLLAERYLRQLDENPGTFEDVRASMAAVRAHFYLNQRKYEQAIEPLQQAIELSKKDKKAQARYSYIIGQIHQIEGRSDAAYASFEQVIKFRPEYEMEFNARLKMATNSWSTGKGTADAAKKNLERMLKDIKNEEYKDAIYFALADIALKQGLREEGITYLKQCVWNSISNKAQQTEAYLMLADLHFEDEIYKEAKYYYDSTFQLMAKTDERWRRVNKMNNNLTDIAKNIEIIETQDSLLAISAMSDEEKREVAARIKKQRDEERRAAAAAAAKKAALAAKIAGRKSAAAAGAAGLAGGRPGSPGAGRQAGGTGSSNALSFFGYSDDRDLKRQEKDFTRAWGVRQLSDNWRRSSAVKFTDLEEQEEEALAANLDEDAIAAILKDVPSTPDQIKAANKAIENAMFDLGSLYRDRLENYERSVETLEKLLERYPETQYVLDAMYFLYLAHTDLNNTTKANYYKDKIIREYPGSKYARFFTDPNFLKDFLTEEGKLNDYYNQTYGFFSEGNYQVAFDRISKVNQTFGSTNKLQPRFALLSALCVGNLQGKDAYVKSLKDVVAKYPETQEKSRAMEILRLLGASAASGPGQNRVNLEESPFIDEEAKLHYILVVLDPSASMNEAKVGVSDYNRKYHKLDKLRISNIYLGGVDNKVPMIVIRRYKDKAKAMSYYDGIQKNSADFLPGYDHSVFPITQNNYRAVLKAKSLDGYKEFFEAYYFN